VDLPSAASSPGHREADFHAFVVTSSPRLLRTAYMLTRDPALAEDLLQTALVKAWSAWDRVDGPPEPYVRRILANTYATWWRRRWRIEEASDELPEPSAAAGGADSSGVEERHDLWVALGRLSRRQRAVVVLRYFDDLTEVATAVALGCSVGTVKSQASKALAHLRVDPALLSTPEENR
jgi:RNA polymerase sigma-70 factor (sigma-E family)